MKFLVLWRMEISRLSGEMLLARSPVYNYATFDVMPLADMSSLPVQPPQ